MKIIDWIIYLLGVFLIAGTAHELIHFIDCGGEFMAGVGWIDGRISLEQTWCVREARVGEVLPTAIEILIWILLVSIKWREQR